MRPARRLRADRRGSPTAEFAMLLPVMLVLLMGLGELAYTAYVRAILTGAMQKAARDSGIQGNDQQTAAIDAKVATAVRAIAAAATFSSSRKSYAQYGYIAPEPFTDINHNGICDAGEPYFDINNNGAWDADPGASGQGGASDATVYTMVATFPRLFPVAKIVGMSGTATLTSTVILKNQPYASQTGTTAPPTKNCP